MRSLNSDSTLTKKTPTGKEDEASKGVSNLPTVDTTQDDGIRLCESVKEVRRFIFAKHNASKKRVNRKKRSIYDSHDGEDNDEINWSTVDNGIERLKQSLQHFGFSDTSYVLTFTENLVALVVSLSYSTNTNQSLAIMTLYLKTLLKRSITEEALKYLRALVVVPEETISGELFDTQAGYLDGIRHHYSNWKMFVKHTGFKKVSNLLSCIVSLGLCEEANFNWSIGGLELFKLKAKDKQASALDLCDAVVETLVFFVEGGFECFKTGSLEPLLYSDVQSKHFSDEVAFLSANIIHVGSGNLEKFAKITDNDFADRLIKALTTASRLEKSCNGWDKKYFTDKYAQLCRIKVQFDTKRTRGGLRIAPYCVNIYGSSGVGKSSVSQITMVSGLMYNGYSAADDRIITLNEADKYWSTYKTSTNGVYIDDIGNTNPKFVDAAPTSKIIDIINNVKTYANMAAVDEKGAISVEPKWVNITTNTKDMGASYYSLEPASIARRANVTVTVTVKPKFTRKGVGSNQLLDPELVEREWPGGVPFLPDIWNITVERAFPVPNQATGGRDTISHQVVNYKNKDLVNISITEYLEFIFEDSKTHFKNQDKLVSRSKNLDQQLQCCTKCWKPAEMCACIGAPAPQVADAHFGFEIGKVVGSVVANQAVSLWHHHTGALESWTTKSLINWSKHMEDEVFFSWTMFLPDEWMKSPIVKQLAYYTMSDRIMREVITRYTLITILLIGVLAFQVYKHCASPFCFVALILVEKLITLPKYKWYPKATFVGINFLIWLAVALHCDKKSAHLCIVPNYVIIKWMALSTYYTKQRVYKTILRRRDGVEEALKNLRENSLNYIIGAIGVWAVLYSLYNFKKGFDSMRTQVHGALSPESDEEVDERDAEVNPWQGAAPLDPIPVNEAQKTITPDDCMNVVQKNLCYMRCIHGSKVTYCDAIFLESGYLLIPEHMWHPFLPDDKTIVPSIKVEFIKRNMHICNAQIDRAHAHHIPDTDFSLVYVPNCGSIRSIVKYLPLERIMRGQVHCAFRTKEGEIRTFSGVIEPSNVSHRFAQFAGGWVTYNIQTFKGLCMAPLIARGKAAQIVGFHLGGETGTTRGCFGLLTQSQYQAAKEVLFSKEGVLPPVDEGNFRTEMYDVHFLASTTIHDKSPVNYIKPGYNIEVFGSTHVRGKTSSQVRPSIITDSVAKICGVENKWGPPQFFPRWKPWYDSLSYSAFPSAGVPASHLVPAVVDYKQGLYAAIDKCPKSVEYLKPLSKMECICGIDGVRFIDQIHANTSIGFPLTGTKEKWLTSLPVDEESTHASPRKLDEKFWIEANKLENEYLQGRRGYPVFKACLKDEATLKTKAKVRVFQAAPIHFSLLIRKYFLPVVRVLSILPLASECAVGVNCQGPEWDEMLKHVTQYGVDRILAGDYSKYDLRMPAQLILTAFRVLIDIARKYGIYSEEDVKIMTGIAYDIAYSVTDYDGTLLQFVGSNPSGHNLTVYINSIVNSLLIRCAFYSRKETASFRSACALMTYGDDAFSSVSERFPWFNHLFVADYLERHDMKFTMPNKTDTPTEYMHLDTVDFLKRKHVYHEALSSGCGALDQESIIRSLHCGMISGHLSNTEQCVQNIDGALREWFLHGPEVYEQRRKEMCEICKIHGFVIAGTQQSYDDRALIWLRKYKPETIELSDATENCPPVCCTTHTL